MTYAGAKGNLLISKNKELTRLKTSRKSIVGQFYGQNTKYMQGNIVLTKGDIIYLLSDGIIDAVSPSRRRFGSVKLQKVLNEINHLCLDEQSQKITEALAEHKGGTKQRDDISVIGLRI